MKGLNRLWTSILSAFALLILILDAQTALKGAKEGITICLYTVIPSLFPFLIFASLINSATIGVNIPLFRPIGKLCGIPTGSESLLLLGLIGGYPVGAQGVYQAYKNNAISRRDAQRMLSFCSNAGPAFIFGMMSGMFYKKTAVLLLWIVHIVSAIMVGLLLPNKSKNKCSLSNYKSMSFISALELSIKVIGEICGWVVIFRVFISFLNHWILWIVPSSIQTLVIGLLELSNGCISLFHITPEGLRFVLASVLLSFGGICVYMQTKSVTKELGTGFYFPGKILQCLISTVLSSIIQHWLFSSGEVVGFPVAFYIVMFVFIAMFFTVINRKNNSRNLSVNSV